MTGKELLLAAMRGEETPRPAWLPFVGCHGGKLIGRTAAEYLRSADLLVEGLKKAHQFYSPDGLPVMFDLQLEAEILGCELHWADEVPPSVISHPLADPNTTLADLPEVDRTKGRLPMAMSSSMRGPLMSTKMERLVSRPRSKMLDCWAMAMVPGIFEMAP